MQKFSTSTYVCVPVCKYVCMAYVTPARAKEMSWVHEKMNKHGVRDMRLKL